MKKFLLAIPLLLFSLVLFAQDEDNTYWSYICVISDNDGYTNVRGGCSTSSAVVGKVSCKEIFLAGRGSCSSMEEIWYNPQYEQKDGYRKSCEEGVGYMHKSRIMPLSKLNRLNKWAMADDGVKIENDSIVVSIKTKKFSETEHTIDRNVEEGWVETIDKKQAWGIDGWVPQVEIASISIKNNHTQEVYHLPKSAIKNLYEPTIAKGYTGVFIGRNNELYIVMNNSDGAGSYLVGWAIVDMKLKTMNLITPF